MSNIKKNKNAHNGETGSLATASGYATKAKPAPKQNSSVLNEAFFKTDHFSSYLNWLHYLQIKPNGLHMESIIKFIEHAF